MKKVLFVVVITIYVLACQAQLSLGLHAGASNKAALGGLHIQQNINKLVLSANETTHLDRQNGAMFSGRVGIQFGDKLSIQPFAGYCFMLVSTDRREYGSYLTAGLHTRYIGDRDFVLYLDAFYVNHIYGVTLGIGGILGNKRE